jgi:hypothetical protein
MGKALLLGSVALLLASCWGGEKDGVTTITDEFEVGPAGGAFRSRASGNPAEGVSLQLAENAVVKPVKLSLGYATAAPKIRAGLGSGVVLVVVATPDVTFEQPLTIGVSFTPNAKYKGLVGYRIEPDGGGLRPIDLLDVDLKTGKATFSTFQPLRFTWVYLL